MELQMKNSLQNHFVNCVTMENEFSSDITRLPPEVWLIIAKELLKTGSNDFENLVNSSEFFQDVLASLRTTFLFEKVLPFVGWSVWENGLEGLQESDFLNLRGVCTHWNLVIDKLVAGKLQPFGEVLKDAKVADIGSALKEFVICNHAFTHLTDDESEINESIHDFLRLFESSHPGHQPKPNGRNPFVFGDIYVNTKHIKDENVKEYQQFLEAVTTMLSKYGSHIHALALRCNGDEFPEPKIAPLVQKWFSCLPNLEELSFKKHYDNRLDNETALIPVWKFPKYKRLEKLETCELPVNVFNPLIRQNNHVSTLIVQSVLNGYDFFTFPLPNLKTLKIENLLDEHLEQLKSLKEEWRLENLSIDLAIDYVGYEALLQVIQDKFFSTLASLEIQMFHEEGGDEGPHWLGFKNFRLQLPKLTKIHLFMYRNKVCLDFLLGMKHNLEEISMTVNYKLPLMLKGTFTSGTIVQFMGFEGKMLESNIWWLFKKLRKIEISAKFEEDWETRVYSREEWMLNNEYI